MQKALKNKSKCKYILIKYIYLLLYNCV